MICRPASALAVKEYKLYESLFSKNNLTETKANIIVDTLINSSKHLNRGALKRQKYNLISEIKKHYDVTKFFSHKLPHYKIQAAFYTLIESFSQENPSNHQQVIDNKDMIHGITIHFVSSELDGGPIIAQGEIMTSEDDEIDNLIERIHTLEHELYPEIIKYICDNRINIYSNEVKFKNLSLEGTHIYKKYDI